MIGTIRAPLDGSGFRPMACGKNIESFSGPGPLHSCTAQMAQATIVAAEQLMLPDCLSVFQRRVVAENNFY